MKIKILGTRGEIEESGPWHSRHSGILVDKKLLFDLGEEEYLDYSPKLIFITHLHPDHAFFVRKREYIRHNKVKIFAPETKEYPWVERLDGKKRWRGYTITPIPVIHSKKVKSYAYLIEDNKGKKVLFTGDLVWIKKEYHKKFEDVDLVITDASFVRKGGAVRRDKEGNVFGHKGIPDLISVFEKYTGRIVFTHLGSWFFKDPKRSRERVEEELPAEADVKIAYDGMEIKI